MLQSQKPLYSDTKLGTIGTVDQVTSQSKATIAQPRKHRFTVEVVPEPPNGIAVQPQVDQQQTQGTMRQNVEEKPPVQVQQRTAIIPAQKQLGQPCNSGVIVVQQQQASPAVQTTRIVSPEKQLEIPVIQKQSTAGISQQKPYAATQLVGNQASHTVQTPGNVSPCQQQLQPVEQKQLNLSFQPQPYTATQPTEHLTISQHQASSIVPTPGKVSSAQEIFCPLNQQQWSEGSSQQQSYYRAAQVTHNLSISQNQPSTIVPTSGNVSSAQQILYPLNQQQWGVDSSQQQPYAALQPTKNLSLSLHQTSPIVPTFGSVCSALQTQRSLNQQQWSAGLSQQQPYTFPQPTQNLSLSQRQASPIVPTPGMVSSAHQILHPLNQQSWSVVSTQQRQYTAPQPTQNLSFSQYQDSPSVPTPEMVSSAQQILYPLNQQPWSVVSTQQQPYTAPQPTQNLSLSQYQGSPSVLTPGNVSSAQQNIYPLNQQQSSTGSSQQQPYIAPQPTQNLSLSQYRASPSVLTPGNVSSAQQNIYPLNQQQRSTGSSQEQSYTAAQPIQNMSLSQNQASPIVPTPGKVSSVQRIQPPLNQQNGSAGSPQQQPCTASQPSHNLSSSHHQSSQSVPTPGNVSSAQQIQPLLYQQNWSAGSPQQQPFTASQSSPNLSSPSVSTLGNVSSGKQIQPPLNQQNWSAGSPQQQQHTAPQPTQNLSLSQSQTSPIVPTPEKVSSAHQIQPPLKQQNGSAWSPQQEPFTASQPSQNLSSSHHQTSPSAPTPGNVSSAQQIQPPLNQQNWSAWSPQQQPHTAPQPTQNLSLSQNQASPIVSTSEKVSSAHQIQPLLNQQNWSAGSPEQQPDTAPQPTQNLSLRQNQDSPIVPTPGKVNSAQQGQPPLNQQEWSAGSPQQELLTAPQPTQNLSLSQNQDSPIVLTAGKVSSGHQLLQPVKLRQLTSSLSQQQFCTSNQETRAVTPGNITSAQQLPDRGNQQQQTTSSFQQQPYTPTQINISPITSPIISQSPINANPLQQLPNLVVQLQWNSTTFGEQPKSMNQLQMYADTLKQQLYPPVQQPTFIAAFQPMTNFIMQSDGYANNNNFVQQVFKLIQPLGNINSIQQLSNTTSQIQGKDQQQPIYVHNGIHTQNFQQAQSLYEHNGNLPFQQLQPVCLCQSLAQGINPAQVKYDAQLPNHDNVKTLSQHNVPLNANAQSEQTQEPSNADQASTEDVNRFSKSLKHTLQPTSSKEIQQKAIKPIMGNLSKTHEKLLPTISENEILVVESPLCSTSKNAVPNALKEPTSLEKSEKAVEINRASTIDYKIDHSINLVKEFLLTVVGDEIKLYKKNIGELENLMFKLEAEHGFLKQNASSDTLAQLQSLRLGSERQPKLNTN